MKKKLQYPDFVELIGNLKRYFQNYSSTVNFHIVFILESIENNLSHMFI